MDDARKDYSCSEQAYRHGKQGLGMDGKVIGMASRVMASRGNGVASMALVLKSGLM